MIRTLCALQASLQIFERRMRTSARIRVPASHLYPSQDKGDTEWCPLCLGWDSWIRTSVVQESKSCAFTSLAISQRMLYDIAPSLALCHYSILFILCQYFLSQKAYRSEMLSSAIGSVHSMVAIQSVHSSLNRSESASSLLRTSSAAR